MGKEENVGDGGEVEMHTESERKQVAPGSEKRTTKEETRPLLAPAALFALQS